MPEIEIGVYQAEEGPKEARTTFKFLRIASITDSVVRVPQEAEKREHLTEYVTRLLKMQESRIAELLFAIGEGSVGFEEDEKGDILRILFRYPELDSPTNSRRVN